MAKKETGPGKGHVLVMDDEEILLKLMRIHLEGEGFSTKCFSSPGEGLEAFRQKPDDFSFAILDMTMPGMRGDQAALRLKEIRPDIPVLLCSGYSDGFDEDHLPGGVDSFLYKPFGRDELIKEIGKMLRLKSSPSGDSED